MSCSFLSPQTQHRKQLYVCKRLEYASKFTWFIAGSSPDLLPVWLIILLQVRYSF